MPRGTKQVQELTGPPWVWHFVSSSPTQGGLGRLPERAHLWPRWEQVARRVTLNFQRTQRSPSGVLTAALSHPPWLKGTGVTRHPLQWSRPPPPLGPRLQWHPSVPPRAPWSVSNGETDTERCLFQGTWNLASPAPGRAEMMGLWLRRLITLKVQPVPTGSTKRF